MIDVVAQRGSSYLLQVGEREGRVFDLRHGRLYAVMSLDSILARGYWEDFVGDPAAVIEALASAEDVSGRPDQAVLPLTAN
jgi:hypothetical protein